MEELRRCAGTQFDPDVVEVLGLVLLDDTTFPDDARTAEATASERSIGTGPR